MKALIINSLADHFIEDFLAAGHVASPRSNFHDLPSASLHDVYNKWGLMFKVRTEGPMWGKLSRLGRGLGSDLPPQVRSDTAIHLDIHRSDIIEFLDRMGDYVGDREVIFLGDDELIYNPDQRTLITLLATRSDLDVVESYLAHRPIDELGVCDWSWKPAAAMPRSRAGLEVFLKPEYDTDNILPPKGDVLAGYYELSQIYTPRFPRAKSEIFDANGLMISGTIQRGALGKGLGVNVDYILNVTAPAGAIKQLSPDGSRTDTNVSDVGSAMLSLGVSYLSRRDLHAIGVNVNALAFVRENSQVRLRIGYGKYRHLDRDPGKIKYGLFYERGFGLLFVDLGIERDYGLDRFHNFGAKWVPCFGLTGMLPLTWIYHLRPKGK
jgi:hypothetical protein